MVIIYTGMFLSGLKSEVIELHSVMSGYFYSSGKPKGITSRPLMLFKKGITEQALGKRVNLVQNNIASLLKVMYLFFVWTLTMFV